MWSRSGALVITTIAVFFAACAGDPIAPGGSVLQGLVAGESNDTSSTIPPPTNPTPGRFHGFVIGHGTFPDTMATAPRLANVRVTIYPHLGWQGDVPTIGAEAGSVTTDANGAFQAPTLPGGDYVVTFVPPQGSVYGGTYVRTTVHAGSDEGNWWVILPLT